MFSCKMVRLRLGLDSGITFFAYKVIKVRFDIDTEIAFLLVKWSD